MDLSQNGRTARWGRAKTAAYDICTTPGPPVPLPPGLAGISPALEGSRRLRCLGARSKMLPDRQCTRGLGACAERVRHGLPCRMC